MPVTRNMAAKKKQQQSEDEHFFDVTSDETDDDRTDGERRGVAMQTQPPTLTTGFALHPHDVGKLIPEYSEGDGVVKWLRRIDHFRVLYGWSEQVCLLYASTRLSGAAANWYRRHEEQIFNWMQFKDQVTLAFPETFDEADIHRQLEAVKIEKDESYESYVYRVDAMAQKGDFSTSATMKYIIKGLRNDKVYSSLLSMQFKSTLEMLRHIKWVASNLSMVPQAPSRFVKIAPTSTSEPVGRVSTEVTCFNCREPGHKSIDCPKPQRRERCGRCLKVGHATEKCFSAVQKEPYQVGPKVAGRSSTNAVFQGGSLNAVAVDESSQAMVELDVAEERIRALALVDSDE
nr:uncharacterized protein LOC115265447 [Aedes albopictus]